MTSKKDKETTAAEEAVEQEFLQKQVGGTEENLATALDELPPEPEQRNIYTYQMSSTVEALCAQDDFWKLKLTT
jgi:hypothetical protein